MIDRNPDKEIILTQHEYFVISYLLFGQIKELNQNNLQQIFNKFDDNIHTDEWLKSMLKKHILSADNLNIPTNSQKQHYIEIMKTDKNLFTQSMINWISRQSNEVARWLYIRCNMNLGSPFFSYNNSTIYKENHLSREEIIYSLAKLDPNISPNKYSSDDYKKLLELVKLDNQYLDHFFETIYMNNVGKTLEGLKNSQPENIIQDNINTVSNLDNQLNLNNFNTPFENSMKSIATIMQNYMQANDLPEKSQDYCLRLINFTKNKKGISLLKEKIHNCELQNTNQLILNSILYFPHDKKYADLYIKNVLDSDNLNIIDKAKLEGKMMFAVPSELADIWSRLMLTTSGFFSYQLTSSEMLKLKQNINDLLTYRNLCYKELFGNITPKEKMLITKLKYFIPQSSDRLAHVLETTLENAYYDISDKGKTSIDIEDALAPTKRLISEKPEIDNFDILNVIKDITFNELRNKNLSKNDKLFINRTLSFLNNNTAVKFFSNDLLCKEFNKFEGITFKSLLMFPDDIESSKLYIKSRLHPEKLSEIEKIKLESVMQIPQDYLLSDIYFRNMLILKGIECDNPLNKEELQLLQKHILERQKFEQLKVKQKLFEASVDDIKAFKNLSTHINYNAEELSVILYYKLIASFAKQLDLINNNPYLCAKYIQS